MTESNSIYGNDPSGISDFAQVWATTLGQVLEEIAGSTQACQALFQAPPTLAASSAGDLWLSGVCSGSLRGEMSLRFSPATATRLAQIFMGEPASPQAELTAEYREAVIELMRQVSGQVVTTLRTRRGELQFHLESCSGPPSWPTSTSLWLQVGEPDLSCFAELHVSAALAAALRLNPAQPQASAASAEPVLSSPPAADAVNLDLLMDVELAVTLRFGGRRLLLREVLDLNPGAVIDLDRQVQDPVDMLLDNRVIARGEVVVMDGNYALRITEVAP